MAALYRSSPHGDPAADLKRAYITEAINPLVAEIRL